MSHVTRYLDVAGPAGAIRAFVAEPRTEPIAGAEAPVTSDTGGLRPAVLFYSDIFQLTGPHLRLARRLADRGYVVLAPELYGRFEAGGTVLDFERDQQRALDDSARVRVEGLRPIAGGAHRVAAIGQRVGEEREGAIVALASGAEGDPP